MSQDIETWFAKAGLVATIESRPVIASIFADAVNTKDIFQMTIDRDTRFRIYPGHESNIVQVVDADRNKRQVVLLVKEPAREYQINEYDHQGQRGRNSPAKVRKKWQRTPAYARKYLCGMDEIHLFIAEIPRSAGSVNTVTEAHRVLRPGEVARARSTPVRRQGEWFFTPATSAEQAEIATAIKKGGFLKCHEGVSPSGVRKPHVADEVIRLPSEVQLPRVVPAIRVFARGRVKHPDHHTITLRDWHRITLNTEVRRSALQGNNLLRDRHLDYVD